MNLEYLLRRMQPEFQTWELTEELPFSKVVGTYLYRGLINHFYGMIIMSDNF